MALKPNSKLKVAIVSGGTSPEASVSRRSAEGVVANLATHYPRLDHFELDKNLVNNLQASAPDVIFPVLHGPPGEDGTVQGLFQMMELPFVGSDVHASAIAMDKIAAKGLFATIGLPLAGQYILHRHRFTNAQLSECISKLGSSLVVKPVHLGSALGVTRIQGADSLADAVSEAFLHNERLLVEAQIQGREMTVGVLERGDQIEAFPVIEIVTPSDAWYDYEHRYTPGASTHLMPAALPNDLTQALQNAAISAHQVLGCRDLSRTDFIVDDSGEFVVLEVNTLPGMTPTSIYPEGAEGLGLAFDELLITLIEQAYHRGSR